MRGAITLAILFLTTANAAAHTGHGIGTFGASGAASASSFLHYATEPQHLGVGAALALLAAMSVATVRTVRALRTAPHGWFRGGRLLRRRP